MTNTTTDTVEPSPGRGRIYAAWLVAVVPVAVALVAPTLFLAPSIPDTVGRIIIFCFLGLISIYLYCLVGRELQDRWYDTPLAEYEEKRQALAALAAKRAERDVRQGFISQEQAAQQLLFGEDRTVSLPPRRFSRK